MSIHGRTVRRGLPRRPGGDAWPSASGDPGPVAEAGPSTNEALASASVRIAGDRRPDATPFKVSAVGGHNSGVVETPTDGQEAARAAVSVESFKPVSLVAVVGASGDRPLRRGLPRAPGTEPWPPAGFAPSSAAAAAEVVEVTTGVATPAASDPGMRDGVTPSQVRAAASGALSTDLSVPLPFTRSAWAGQSAHTRPGSRSAPQRIRRFSRLEWVGIVIVGGSGLLIAAGMAVLAVRFLLSLTLFREFLATYPGEYPLPAGAPVGIPPWLGWQHFFNVFLIVLIIRSGLQIHTDERPTTFWSPQRDPARKITLNLWFHQSLDILWVANGVVYIVLLFATGQWMKIVPTSWAVFPNAISAALQYVSLDWPTENGWVNYNALQQLAYFATVFIAAPLAIATGIRMSGIWPKNAKALNRAYPVEWARAFHFPVMLYFGTFIIVHVALVLATGALRNLNHIYAGRDVINWLGFGIFAASLVVIVIGWIAARPVVLAPIANLFGKVGGR